MSLSAPGHCGIPDVPNNGNIAEATTPLPLQRNSSLEDESSNSSIDSEDSVYFKYQPSTTTTTTLTNTNPISIGELSKHSLQEPIKVTLKITLLDSLNVQWESLLINETLYVYISNPPTGNSKEAFIALLEFAEEELNCKKVIVYFDKQNPDRNIMIRLFSFIGFTLLPPNHPSIYANGSDEMVYLCYDIHG